MTTDTDPTPIDLHPGDRVIWRGRSAVVQWRRHEAPHYLRPGVYSIRLLDVDRADYSGTVVRATDPDLRREEQ